MSGVAIKVPNVNWSKNNLGTVDYGSDKNDNPLTTVSDKAYVIYEDYMDKSQRRDNQYLLLLIDDLIKAGLDQKGKALFYLASKYQNINHIKYSLIGHDNLDSGSAPIISVNGIEVNNNVSLFDHNQYDLGNTDSNLCLVFMMSKASTGGFDWGGEQYKNHVHSFVSAGEAKWQTGVIFRWGGEDAIKKIADQQENDGVYVIHINKKSLVYKHKNVTINKQLSAQSMAKFCPRLMAYSTINDSPSQGIMKLYATFSREDLTAADINKIHEIFTKYEHLL